MKSIFSKIALGGGAFNPQYDNYQEDDENEIATSTIRRAFELGINLIDTSPYYGRSEIIIGNSLAVLASDYPRSSYYISTKIGRYGPQKEHFDYSASRVRESVAESLRRLKTDYLDVVFCHDVEFVDDHIVLEEALPALFELKEEGKIKCVGISGYPLPVLDNITRTWVKIHPEKPLDIIMSYCHYTIHSTDILPYISKFKESGVKTILNASPLSMRMLTTFGPPLWHPAKQDLKDAVKEVQVILESEGVDIAELATLFGFGLGYQEFVKDFHKTEDLDKENYLIPGISSIVIGASTPKEVELAFARYNEVIGKAVIPSKLKEKRLQLLGIVVEKLKPFWNYSWPSP
ncbi:hypothetical protein HK096_006590 [Nowakowskiella sp. JEL0078]|nr:hypothetical protein HK096_006590 [Nowakowskiella sp. JEL0078]